MKTKNRTKNRTKLKPTPKLDALFYQPPASPTDKVVWVDIHDSGKLADGLHQPVEWGFMSPNLVKLLNRLLDGSRLGEVDEGQDGHTIEVCGDPCRVVEAK